MMHNNTSYLAKVGKVGVKYYLFYLPLVQINTIYLKNLEQGGKRNSSHHISHRKCEPKANFNPFYCSI